MLHQKNTQILLLLIILCSFGQSIYAQEVEIQSSGHIKNVKDPVDPQDALTKAYVDEMVMKFSIAVGAKAQDADGNIYSTVQIGDQRWMLENLRTTKYNDSTSIALVSDNFAWSNLETPGYCFFDTTGRNYSLYAKDPFGALYNYYVVADTNSRNVCPVGWHIPSDSEWTTLFTFLGGGDIAGGKMKTTGTVEGGTGYWLDPNTGATNSSGFSGLPGGYRFSNGNFLSIASTGFWWSGSESNSNDGDYIVVTKDDNLASLFSGSKKGGFSVRCVKD